MYIQEIEKSSVLQKIYYFVIFTFFLTFTDWRNLGLLTKESVTNFNAVCWPHFQECTYLYIFNNIPEGYSLGILYSFLGLFIFGSLFFAFQNKWKEALLLLSPLIVFKFVTLYFLSYFPTGNYAVFELFVAVLLVFSKNKVFNLKVFLTLFYFLALSIKFHEGYYSGNIFRSLKLGVPIFPDNLLFLYGLVFIFILVIFPALLWFQRNSIRFFVVLVLVTFHLYSIILVGFRYPLLCITLLLLLFYISEHESFSIKKVVKDYTASLVFISLIILQMVPILIPGDEKITNEGQKYGFYMFDANRQCVSQKNIYYKNGTKETLLYENYRGFYRCDPYEEWFKIKQRCETGLVKSVEWQFDSSINGSSYFTLVNTSNACLLDYKPFRHNPWIQEGVKNQEIKVYKNSVSSANLNSDILRI